MANLNKVMLIGRLTRDPEPIGTTGAGAKFGFVVSNRKQNRETKQWEDTPVWIDCEVWNRGETGKQADQVLANLKKGSQIHIEGHLKLDEWEDKTSGQKRTKLSVVVDNFQYLDRKSEDAGGGGDTEHIPNYAPPPKKGGGKTTTTSRKPAAIARDEDVPF